MNQPRLEIPPGAVCRGCGYALRGLETPRCPECGRGFDPALPATMRFPASERPLWRRWGGDLYLRELAKPTDRPTRALPAIAAAVTLGGGSMGRWGEVILWPGYYLWLCLAAGQGVVWVMRRVAVAAGGLTPEQARVDRRFERRALGWAAATAILISLGVPLRVGFWVSRPWLDDVVREARLSNLTDPPLVRDWAGIYPVRQVERDLHGVVIRTSGVGFYFKDVPGACDRHQPGEPLGHDWYILK